MDGKATQLLANDSVPSQDLINAPTDNKREQLFVAPHSHATTSFSPYLNRSSFLLGEWYWKDGTQKSQRNFKNLINVLGHPDFRVEDVTKTKWSNINTTLSSSRGTFDAGDVQPEWMDESWKCSPITIQVPFHWLTGNPGSHPYSAGEFYHCSLVSVIKEWLKSADAGTHLHLHPHELLWKRGLKDIRVYGEMYNLDKLLEMHHELQNSASVPSCNAPQAILPLMFWSDSTHLISFGQAKLWPLYMFFGSDSKYRRSKSNENLCSHIAYFQKVSFDLYLYLEIGLIVDVTVTRWF